SEVYRLAGETDELIQWDTEKQPAPQEQQVIPLAEIDRWKQEFANDPDVEALAPYLQEQVPVQNQRTLLNESSALVVALRPDDIEAFGGVRDLSGNAVQVGPGEIAVNKKLAEQIDAEAG